MTQSLEEVVDIYLKMDTNYALMITGEWGVGKTFYYKNVLKEKIKNTDTNKDASKKYRPIHISLFGLKSIDEIQTEIFISIYPLLKNTKLKLGVSLGKALIKGILKFKEIGHYYDYVNEIDIDKEDYIKFEDLVLCFDDLERMSSELEIEEFIGYINSLVENSNAKVILIANENKIEKSIYFSFKEKIVGNTIEFIPNLNKSFDDILETKFKSFKHYREFLSLYKQIIIKYYEQNSSNLRTLIFFLSYYQLVFSEIENNIGNDSPLTDKKDEIFLDTLIFTIAIAVEYKLGRISYKKREDLDHTLLRLEQIDFNNVTFSETPDNKVEPNFREDFLSKYFKENRYYYFNSIYDYITGGNTFIYSDFLNELKAKYHIKNNEIAPQYAVLDDLGYQNCFKLSNSDYKKKTRELLNYAYKGLFDLRYYLTAFHFALRFNNPLNLKPENLSKRLIKGMTQGFENSKHTSDITFYMSNPGENPEAKIIWKETVRLNDKLKEIEEKREYQELETLCYTKLDDFLEKIQGHNSQYLFRPIFAFFNPYKFYRFYQKLTPNNKMEFIRMIRSRYVEHTPLYLKPDLNFLTKIKVKADRSAKSDSKGITGFTNVELSNQLEMAISRLNKLSD